MNFLHILNPLCQRKESDLFIAQPVTIKSVENATLNYSKSSEGQVQIGVSF